IRKSGLHIPNRNKTAPPKKQQRFDLRFTEQQGITLLSCKVLKPSLRRSRRKDDFSASVFLVRKKRMMAHIDVSRDARLSIEK
ncbi:MAG: hypothetical protein K5746_06300, partial [Clostridiales bacterium]|nr:hypothetical protein [Clostridiales bacterium]